MYRHCTFSTTLQSIPFSVSLDRMYSCLKHFNLLKFSLIDINYVVIFRCRPLFMHKKHFVHFSFSVRIKCIVVKTGIHGNGKCDLII